MIKKSIFISILTLSFSPLLFSASYTIDNAHTEVGFKVRHMGVSKTRGQFGSVQGEMNWHGEKKLKKASFSGVIQVGSINTLNQKRDDHLRSSDFFYIEKFPKIMFTSKKVYKKNKQLFVSGELKMKGVTKTVDFPIEVMGPVTDFRGNKRIGVEGSLEIDRRDYGITWNKTFDKGGLVVGNTVEISLNVEGISK